ncbi:hypothetical protein E4U35_000897 [Claviceps purpurea]|nr:hypothetical protein E4U35_000897 [Claviceps purpurea]
MARWIGPLHQEKAWTEFRSAFHGWCRSWKNWEQNEDGRKNATDGFARLHNNQQYLTSKK